MEHEPQRLYTLLLEDHPKLEKAYEQVVDACRAGAPELSALWTELESSLERHLTAEEQYVLPEFEKVSPEEAHALRAEHDDIRKKLTELGVCVDLHVLRDEVADAFFAAFRAHGQREDALMHVWLRERIRAEES